MRELRALATLSKAAELGSLSSAAQAQGITPQAASKALMQLERQLGVQLLARTTRRLALTPEGQLLVDASRPALDAMTAALDAVRKASLAPLEGSLTISAPRPVVSTVLAPLVEAFSVLHPKLSLRIASLDDDAPMPEVDDEVTFSLGKPANEEIAVTPLMEIVFVHCASPSYLATHGVPASLEELVTRQAGAIPKEVRGVPDEPDSQAHGQPFLSTNDHDLQVQIVRSGRMALQLAALVAAPHIDDGSFVPLPSLGVGALELSLCHLAAPALLPQVAAFIEFARDRLEGCQDFAPTDARLFALERAATRRPRRAARRVYVEAETQ